MPTATNRRTETAEKPWASGDALRAAGEKKTEPLEELYSEWARQPGPETFEPILKELQPTIDSALNTYAPKSKERLRTRAALLTHDAMESYDPKKGAVLKTHVFNSLKRLYRDQADRDSLVHIPENARLEQGRVHKAVLDFEATHGREPNMVELADKTGISTKRLAKLSNFKNTVPEASYRTRKGDLTYTATKGAEDLWTDFVYYELDPIDKKIFEWSTGRDGTPTLPKHEIAQRLKISAPAVSARINKIIKRLEKPRV